MADTPNRPSGSSDTGPGGPPKVKQEAQRGTSMLKFMPNIAASRRNIGAPGAPQSSAAAAGTSQGGAKPKFVPLNNARRVQSQQPGPQQQQQQQRRPTDRGPQQAPHFYRGMVPAGSSMAALAPSTTTSVAATSTASTAAAAAKVKPEQIKPVSEEERKHREKRRQKRATWGAIQNPPMTIPLHRNPPASGMGGYALQQYVESADADLSDEDDHRDYCVEIATQESASVEQRFRDMDRVSLEEIQKQFFKISDGDDVLENYIPPDELLFIQLPSSLPSSATSSDDNKKAKSSSETQQQKQMASRQSHDANDADESEVVVSQTLGDVQAHLSGISGGLWWLQDYFHNSLTNIPTGFLGEMIIYASGKIKLQLGDILCDVTPATEVSFLQEIYSISDNSCYILGDIKKRVLCMPDVEDMLPFQPVR